MTDRLKKAAQAMLDWFDADTKEPIAVPVKQLRGALAEQESEPVAWTVPEEIRRAQNDGIGAFWGKRWEDSDVPVYTHPPRREWRGLTDKEIEAAISEYEPDYKLADMCRAVEAKLKEKNHD